MRRIAEYFRYLRSGLMAGSYLQIIQFYAS
jgi:hypothetical protein